MEVSWGANLVGMSTKPLDADPYSLFIKKKDIISHFIFMVLWFL